MAEYTGNPASYIINSIQQGLGRTATLRQYRADGGKIDNNIWSALFGQVQSDLQNRPELRNLSRSEQIPRENHTPWMVTEGKAGRFAYHGYVQVEHRDVAIDGRVFYTTTSEYHTIFSDEILSRASAEANIIDDFNDTANVGNSPVRAVGAIVYAAYETVGPNG